MNTYFLQSSHFIFCQIIEDQKFHNFSVKSLGVDKVKHLFLGVWRDLVNWKNIKGWIVYLFMQALKSLYFSLLKSLYDGARVWCERLRLVFQTGNFSPGRMAGQHLNRKWSRSLSWHRCFDDISHTKLHVYQPPEKRAPTSREKSIWYK